MGSEYNKFFPRLWQCFLEALSNLIEDIAACPFRLSNVGLNIFFSDADHVRERGKAIFCDLGYNKADSVLVPLNE